MLCEGMGKFSTKLVKVLAYQKRDYETAEIEKKLKRDAEEKVKQTYIKAKKKVDKKNAEKS